MWLPQGVLMLDLWTIGTVCDLFAGEAGRLRKRWLRASSNQAGVGVVTQLFASDQMEESPGQSEVTSLSGTQCQI